MVLVFLVKRQSGGRPFKTESPIPRPPSALGNFGLEIYTNQKVIVRIVRVLHFIVGEWVIPIICGSIICTNHSYKWSRAWSPTELWFYQRPEKAAETFITLQPNFYDFRSKSCLCVCYCSIIRYPQKPSRHKQVGERQPQEAFKP